MTLPPKKARLLESDDASAWASFLAEHPDATLYHTLTWRDLVRDVFGHRLAYLVVDGDAGFEGVLPLFHVKFPLLGSKLVSLPYDAAAGGPLTQSAEAGKLLAAGAVELARLRRVDYLELRCARERPELEELSFQKSEPVLLTETRVDEGVWSRVSKHHRRAHRTAERNGVGVRPASSVEDFLNFYRVYLRVFREFATPPYPERYFRTLYERLRERDSVRLLLAEMTGAVQGGMLLYSFGRRLVMKFVVCTDEAMRARATAALYGEALDWALERGHDVISWGTASRAQKGVLQYKEGWAGETRPVVFYDMAIAGQVASIDKYYDSEGLVRWAWKRLPLPLTALLGGPLNRWFC